MIATSSRITNVSSALSLLEHPPLGLQLQRQDDEFFLVTAPEVGAAVERHLGNPRAVQLSRAALEVLTIVAYKQPIARAGIERIRGSSSFARMVGWNCRRRSVTRGRFDCVSQDLESAVRQHLKTWGVSLGKHPTC